MKKIFLFGVLALTIVLVVAGCSKQQPYTGYVPYGQQGQGGAPQQVPVAGGCGVIAPADASDTISSESINQAF